MLLINILFSLDDKIAKDYNKVFEEIANRTENFYHRGMNHTMEKTEELAKNILNMIDE